MLTGSLPSHGGFGVLSVSLEESYVSAEQLCKVVKDIDYNKVLNAELAVLQGVDFQLISFGAFRPLRGFRADAIHTVNSDGGRRVVVVIIIIVVVSRKNQRVLY